MEEQVKTLLGDTAAVPKGQALAVAGIEGEQAACLQFDGIPRQQAKANALIAPIGGESFATEVPPAHEVNILDGRLRRSLRSHFARQ